MSDDEPRKAPTRDVLLEMADFGLAGGRTRSSLTRR